MQKEFISSFSFMIKSLNYLNLDDIYEQHFYLYQLHIYGLWLTEKLFHLLSSILTKQLLKTIFIILARRSMFCFPKSPFIASVQLQNMTIIDGSYQ